MSKMKLALDVVQDLRSLADSIETLVNAVDGNEVAPQAKESASKITFQDLRAVLAVLTRDGKQQQVKELIERYGAKKLSEVPEEAYQELLEEARKIQ